MREARITPVCSLKTEGWRLGRAAVGRFLQTQTWGHVRCRGICREQNPRLSAMVATEDRLQHRLCHELNLAVEGELVSTLDFLAIKAKSKTGQPQGFRPDIMGHELWN